MRKLITSLCLFASIASAQYVPVQYNTNTGNFAYGTESGSATNVTCGGDVYLANDNEFTGGTNSFGGKVGIGTTAPAAGLHVEATGDAIWVTDPTDSGQPRIKLKALTDGGYFELRDSDEVVNAVIRGYSSSGVQAYFLAGNVGIGTASPDYGLSILDDDIALYDTTPRIRLFETDYTEWQVRVNGGNFEAYNAASNQFPIRAYSSGILSLVDYANGQVGIKNDTPSYTLDVNGTIRCTGKLTATGGVDPPYSHLWEQSLVDVTNRVAVEVPPSKYKGVVQAYIEDMDALFFWQPSSGHWLRMDMATGAITKGTIAPWLTNQAPFEWTDSYTLDYATGQLIHDQIPINDKRWQLKAGYTLDAASGIFYDPDGNVVTKAQAIEFATPPEQPEEVTE